MAYPYLRRLLALLAVSCLATGCRLPKPQDQARNAVKRVANEAKGELNQLGNVVVNGGELSGQDDQGRPLWSVGASQLHTSSGKSETDKRSVYCDQARATLYRDGIAESHFNAKHLLLVYQDNTTTMTLTDGVQATTSGPQTGNRGPVHLTTPQVDIDVNARKLHADHDVVMTQGETRVSASKLTADNGLRVATLTGNVQASGPQGTATADQAVWNWGAGRAQASGNIHATHGETSVTGARLDADTNLDKGILSGEVIARSPQGEAHAENVDYDWRSEQLAARGNVVLNHGDAHITADRIDTTTRFEAATATGSVTLIQGAITLNAASARASGLGSTSTLQATASGGVTAHSDDGQVTADDVTWSQQEVVASGNVTLSRDGNELSGDRLVAHLSDGHRFNDAVLTGSVHGRLKDGDKVTAGKLVWTHAPGGTANGSVVASGGVADERPGVSLRADRLEISPDHNVAMLTGHAVASTPDGATVSAPRVRYNQSMGMVFADGGVVYRDPANKRELHGRVLKATLKNGKLTRAVMTDVVGSGNMDLFKNQKLFGK